MSNTSMGLPDSSTLDDYGGELQDANPVTNPQTDQPAAGGNQAMADCAGMTRTACRAWVRFQTGTTTGNMILLAFDSVWGGNDTNADPILARIGTGVFTITQPAQPYDELDVQHTLTLKRARAVMEGPNLFFCSAFVTTNVNVVQVNVFSTSFVASDLAGAIVYVEMG